MFGLLKSHMLQPMWAGISGAVVNNNKNYEIAISIHDSVYNTDFSDTLLDYNPNDPPDVEEHVIQTLRNFSHEHLSKFLGAGVTLSLLREVRGSPYSPTRPAKLTIDLLGTQPLY